MATLEKFLTPQEFKDIQRIERSHINGMESALSNLPSEIHQEMKDAMFYWDSAVLLRIIRRLVAGAKIIEEKD